MTRITYPPTQLVPGYYASPQDISMGISAGTPNWSPPNPNILKSFTLFPINVQTISQDLGKAFAPVKAGTKTSHIVFILDDSGSMYTNRDNTIAGFNEYLKSQQADAIVTGIKTFVSLYKFDGYRVTGAFIRVPVEIAVPLSRNTYNPNGGTNLHDALCSVMIQINNTISVKRKRDRDSVIIVVLTDGEENASKTFKTTDVKVMVKKAETKNWGFMFLGANIDAFTASSALGFNAQNTVQFSDQSSANAIRSASAMTSRMKSAYSAGLDTVSTYASTAFSEAERTTAMVKENDK